MRFGSVCSGIEAASVAWLPLGWECAWVAEIEPFASAVLAHHYQEVPNHGDFTRIGKDVDVEPIDLLVGGTPCQSFSVAGKRAGLDDPRGNLTLEYLALAGRLRPRWLAWENVPGVLSDDGGRTFGAIVGALAELGYGFAYCVLDAEYFHLAQRRERVFVVGHLGDWRGPAAVLLEPTSLSGNPAPRREARQDTAHELAPCLGASGRGFERTGDTRGQDCVVAAALTTGSGGGRYDKAPMTVANPLAAKAGGGRRNDLDADTYVPEISPALSARDHKSSRPEASGAAVIAHALRAEGFDASEDGTGRGVPIVVDTLTGNGDAHSGFRDAAGLIALMDERVITSPANRASCRADGATPTMHEKPFAIAFGGQMSTPHWQHDLSDTLQAKNPKAVAFAQNQRGELRESNISPQLTTGGGKPGEGFPAARQGMSVRRLTPRECERLQGFPDDYTLIPYRGKLAADGPRYRVLGNSMAVTVMRWIGERIQLLEASA